MIAGYEDLLALRRSGHRPDGPVLLTDSPTIEFSWAEILKDHPAKNGEVPPCAVLRIVDEEPHDLTAIHGLPVLCMLVRKVSVPWVEQANRAKPSAVIEFYGKDAIDCAAEMADTFFDNWVGAL